MISCIPASLGIYASAASVTDNAIARFDGTTGELIQNSLAILDDNGSINIPAGQHFKVNSVAVLENVVEDTTPQLGGDLDVNGHNIVMTDDEYIGFGAAAGRIIFDDQTTDYISFMDCYVGIGTATPASFLHIHTSADNNIRFAESSGESIISCVNDAVSAYIPFRIYASELNLMGGNVGIGTTTPLAPLTITGADAPTYGTFMMSGASYSDDYIGFSCICNGDDDTDLTFVRKFSGDGAAISVLIFKGSNGRAGMGTLSPAARLHVDQTGASNAIPVLILDQADVSEEFIKFIGTSTTDASQSLVDAADMTTPGSIVGWLRVYIQDDASSGAITDGIYFIPFYSAPAA